MSYGKSVNSHDMRRVYVHVCGSWVCVPAVQMKWKMVGVICASRMHIPIKRKGYMCTSLHVSLTRPRLSPSLGDAPGTIYHGSDVLL